MPSLIVAAAVALNACGALAQGQFTLANRCSTCTPVMDARVFNTDCTTPLAGPAYFAQACIKRARDPESSLTWAGTAVNFRTGSGAGYILPQ